MHASDSPASLDWAIPSVPYEAHRKRYHCPWSLFRAEGSVALERGDDLGLSLA